MYVFALITCSIIVSLLAVLMPTRRKSKVFSAFFVLVLCTLWWHGSWVTLFLETSRSRAATLAIIGHIGILYLPIAYHKLYAEMLGKTLPMRWWHVFYAAMLVILLTTTWIIDGVHEFPWGFYPKAGPLHPIFIGLVTYVVADSFVKSISFLRGNSDAAKSRATKTGILACLIFSLGSYDFLINYRVIDYYPVGFVSSILFVIIIAVGIVGYDLFQREAKIISLNEENVKERIRIQEKERYIQQISRQNQELRVRDEIISSFVSPTVRSEIALGSNPLEYRPQKFQRSVVFIDMRGFTQFAEKSQLDEIFSFVNDYFELVNKAVYSHRGEVNKYLGDGVLALFESPQQCILAISDFIQGLQVFNRRQRSKGLQEIHIGMGISHGEVLCGNFGSDTKLERSVIGDVVNIASRLEKLAKKYNCVAVCDDAFSLYMGEEILQRPIAIELLKGKSKPTIIHEIGFRSIVVEHQYWLSTRPHLISAMQYYAEGQYKVALKELQKIPNQSACHDRPLEVLIEEITRKIESKNDRRSA